ncbi:MAG: hypothetical protein MZV63_59050 [Marinilabiliales bacterium]|nr:hypothetical protein [Marinilabiliales bacterium]
MADTETFTLTVNPAAGSSWSDHRYGYGLPGTIRGDIQCTGDCECYELHMVLQWYRSNDQWQHELHQRSTMQPMRTSGSLTVTASNTCGNGTVSANYPVTVNATNTVGAPSSNAYVMY